MRLIVRAARAQPVILWATVGAFGVAVARQVLLEIPERFPGGAAAGEFVYDLSLAILAAWIFNLVVVAVPRQRNEDLLLVEMAPDLIRISNAARQVLGSMSSASGVALPDQATVDDVTRICNGVSIQATRPGAVTWRNGGLEQLTWWEYIHWQAADVARLHERIAAVYVLLPGDLVAQLREHANAPYVRLVSDHLGNTPLANANFNAFASSLFEYLQRCDRLRACLDSR